MILPELKEGRSIRYPISQFMGYNNSERCSEAEGYDEVNISSDYYPLLTPRSRRVIVESNIAGLKGLHVNNGLVEIKQDSNEIDNVLFYEGERIGQLPGTGRRQMCSMGAYVIIYPDKYRFNTKDKTLGSLGASYSTASTVTFTPCTMDGTTINPTVSSTEPANPTNGQYWLDTSTTPNSLMRWSDSQGMWDAIATSYVKISATNIGKNFNKLDVVAISGVTGTYAETFNTDMAIWDKNDNQIVVTALISTVFTNNGISIVRNIPDLDFICEHDNRIWGCSSEKHEVYGSKVGDPTNWYSYLGTAADSYAATVGTDGDFTGCAAHGGSVIFFKERFIHKLYGTAPSNYQLDTKPERGIQKGCHDSVGLISGVLFYKAVDGVVRYEGSYPTLISKNLGQTAYSEAIGGVWNGVYYVAMKNKTGTQKLFTFNTSNGLWHVEDSPSNVEFMTEYENRLLMFDNRRNMLLAAGDDTKIGQTTYSIDPAPLLWERTFGIVGIDSPSQIDSNFKYVSQVLIRFYMELDATFKVEVEYDSLGEWETVCDIKNKYEFSRKDTQSFSNLRSMEIPFIPKRCDHMRIRISGSGYAKIFSITKKIEGGGL